MATLRSRNGEIGAAGVPVPPARLRFRVHGDVNADSYITTGQTLAQNIQTLCTATGRDFESFTSVLDFGCGCGRVIQHLQSRSAPSTKLFASDIDHELVEWGSANLRGIQWSINNHRPPLPFNDESFDLIYAISVFTHLDQDYEKVWLQELRRVARPEATLILTVHGKYAFEMMGLPFKAELEHDGFIFISDAKGRFKLDGFPDFYQTACHTKEYVKKQWSTLFEVVDYVERGINDHQDAVVLKKSSLQ
jgi:SAM-dependent methyltransferase